LRFQLLEAQIICAIFQNNALKLCSELSDNVVQHLAQCIETTRRHVEYLFFLPTIVKAEGQIIRKNWSGRKYPSFTTTKALFNDFLDMMSVEWYRLELSTDSSGALK
jgi:hypothetical protein